MAGTIHISGVYGLLHEHQMEKKCRCAAQGKCVICGVKVATEEGISSFGECFCSEEHLEEYMRTMWGLQRKAVWARRQT
jgi:hypothetical protein